MEEKLHLKFCYRDGAEKLKTLFEELSKLDIVKNFQYEEKYFSLSKMYDICFSPYWNPKLKFTLWTMEFEENNFAKNTWNFDFYVGFHVNHIETITITESEQNILMKFQRESDPYFSIAKILLKNEDERKLHFDKCD